MDPGRLSLSEEDGGIDVEAAAESFLAVLLR
jgi:hypothetical protein